MQKGENWELGVIGNYYYVWYCRAGVVRDGILRRGLKFNTFSSLQPRLGEGRTAVGGKRVRGFSGTTGDPPPSITGLMEASMPRRKEAYSGAMIFQEKGWYLDDHMPSNWEIQQLIVIVLFRKSKMPLLHLSRGGGRTLSNCILFLLPNNSAHAGSLLPKGHLGGHIKGPTSHKTQISREGGVFRTGKYIQNRNKYIIHNCMYSTCDQKYDSWLKKLKPCASKNVRSSEGVGNDSDISTK